MFELEQIRLGLSGYDEKLEEMGGSLDVAGAREKIAELEELSADPDFWNDLEKSQKTLQQLKGLKNKVGKFEGLVTTYEDILTLIEMGIEEQDESVYEEVKEMNETFLAEFEQLRIATLLDGEYDRNNAIITLHAGTGGTEACDWTNMLYRMYTRWAQKEGFEVELLDMLDGDEAGLKSVTFQINGENAYGYMKSEKGIHRLYFALQFHLVARKGGIDLVLPEIPEGQLINTADIICVPGVIHGGISGLVGRRLAVLRMGTPNLIVPDEQGLGQQEQGNQRSSGCYGTHDPAFDSLVPAGPEHNIHRAQNQQYQSADPPHGRKAPQHISQEHGPLIQIEQIRQPHQFVESLVVTGLTDGPAGDQIVTDSIDDPAGSLRQTQRQCGHQQGPGAAEGQTHPVTGLQKNIRIAFHKKIGQCHPGYLQPGKGGHRPIFLFSISHWHKAPPLSQSNQFLIIVFFPGLSTSWKIVVFSIYPLRFQCFSEEYRDEF